MMELRFGKAPPTIDYRTFRFSSYLKDDVPIPPESLDVLDRVYANLGESDPAVLFPMDGNDQVGNCTIAAYAHADTVWRGLIGEKKIMSEQLCIKIYNKLTHGNDSGLSMLQVLEFLRKNSIQDDKLLAYVSINHHNRTHIKQAIAIFGGIYLGFQCQENVKEDFRMHKPWTAGDLVDSGHAVYVTAYDPTGVSVLTWGDVQCGTWDWWDCCVDEAFVLLTPEMKNPLFAPDFDFVKLQRDLVQIADFE